VALQMTEFPLPFIISSMCIKILIAKSKEAKIAAVCNILCENW